MDNKIKMENVFQYLFQSFLAVFLWGRDELAGDRRRRAARLRRRRLWLQLGGNYETQKAQNRGYKIHFLRAVYILQHIMLLFWRNWNQYTAQRSRLHYLAKILYYWKDDFWGTSPFFPLPFLIKCLFHIPEQLHLFPSHLHLTLHFCASISSKIKHYWNAPTQL